MGTEKTARSLRAIATISAIEKEADKDPGRKISAVARLVVVSVSYAALGVTGNAPAAHAQTAEVATQNSHTRSQLPPIEVTSPETGRHAGSAPALRADRGSQRHRSQTARRAEATETPKAAFVQSQDARTGTVGYCADSTSVGDQDQYAADQRSAVRQRSDQAVHSGPEHPQHHRPVALRSGRCWCIRAKATATNSSFAASTPARTSSSTASATTFNTTGTSTTRRALKC